MNDIRIQIVDLRRTLLNRSLNAAWAASSCHIHPLGMDMKEAESRVIEWYSSLEECEMANKKLFRGSGICHCFPDGIFNRTDDDWRSRLKDYGTPQDSLSD